MFLITTHAVTAQKLQSPNAVKISNIKNDIRKSRAHKHHVYDPRIKPIPDKVPQCRTISVTSPQLVAPDTRASLLFSKLSRRATFAFPLQCARQCVSFENCPPFPRTVAVDRRRREPAPNAVSERSSGGGGGGTSFPESSRRKRLTATNVLSPVSAVPERN